MKKCLIWRHIKKYVLLTIAAVGYGMALALLLDKNHLVPGGLSGLSLLIGRMTHIPSGSLLFVLNIPIMGIGIWKCGASLILDSFYAIAVSSIAVNVFAKLPPLTDDVLVAALAGGALTAVCIGTILKQGATTGGMDIVVLLLRRKYRQFKAGTLFLMADSMVITMSAVVFRNIDEAFYSVITVVTSSMLLDMVLYGRDEAKLMYIMLKEGRKEEVLAERLLKELAVGVTYLQGYGGFCRTQKQVILCAVHKNQLPKAKEIVRSTDDEAFLIVTSANEIMGEGYKSHYGGL